jgi:FtsH-binding integral membrane protein
MKRLFSVLLIGVCLASAISAYAAPGVRSVPEPTTLVLLGLGVIGLAGLRKFRK